MPTPNRSLAAKKKGFFLKVAKLHHFGQNCFKLPQHQMASQIDSASTGKKA